MKPETRLFMAKGRKALRQAEVLLGIGEHEIAGRSAYLAGFHAAQALIFERMDRVTKTHKGVLAEFSRLVKDDPKYDADQKAFLGRNFELKTIADYGVDPDVTVSESQATTAIGAARSFLAAVEATLNSEGPAR